jgi:hypothetical protein
MASSDVGVVPSMSEWFCYTAIQMQAMWLSLIASNVWALSEVLSPETTVFIPYGKIQDLYQALVDMSEKKHRTFLNISMDSTSTSIDYKKYRKLFV